jgi:hypothetical protein
MKRAASCVVCSPSPQRNEITYNVDNLSAVEYFRYGSFANHSFYQKLRKPTALFTSVKVAEALALAFSVPSLITLLRNASSLPISSILALIGSVCLQISAASCFLRSPYLMEQLLYAAVKC